MALDARSTLKPASEANGGAIPLPTGKSSPGPGVRERLAVIIPVHNGGEELRRCLQAVMLSATRPDEVIVVDDASTDGSADIAQRAGAQVVRLSAFLCASTSTYCSAPIISLRKEMHLNLLPACKHRAS